MSQKIEWQLEIDVVTVTNDTEGYQTPLTSTAVTPTYGEKTLKFASTTIESDFETGYARVIEGFTLNTPELKSGLGVGSRASATITMLDFVGDPDEFTPAVVNDPDTIRRGTYFSKLNARHLLVNRPARFIGKAIGSPTYTYNFVITDFKQIASDKWQLTCRDVLYRLEDEKTVFPKALSVNVTNAPGTTGTTINTNGLSSDWSTADNVLCMGTEVLPINSITGTSNISFSVTRGASVNYTIGSTNARTLKNYQRSDIAQGDSIFRGRRYDDASLADIIIDILTDSGIDSSYYDAAEIQNTIDNWVGVQNISCVFNKPMPSIDVLNNICQTFLIDIYTTPDGQIKISSTDPWQNTAVRFIEGREITYAKGSIKIDDDLRYSRALLTYGKKDMNEDSSYSSTSFKFNSEYESQYFYGDEKLFTFENSDLLDSNVRSKEIAGTAVSRFVNRWAFRPLVAELEINKTAFDQVEVGDTVYIEHSQIQLPSGVVDTNRRYQITKLQPLNNSFYRMKAVSFTPYFGTNDNFSYDPATGELTAVGAITINENKGINLFVQADSPPPAAQVSEYTFIFDADIIGEAFGNDNKAGSIEIGEGWNAATTFNIVCLNGIRITGIGGNGGAAGRRGLDGVKGSDGGIVIINTSGTAHTLNVYLSGSRTVQTVSYTCDGYLDSPGGGGGGAGAVIGQSSGCGGGGAGFPAGQPGLKVNQSDPNGAESGTLTTGGSGEDAFYVGGTGGNVGNNGNAGQSTGSSTGGAGGLAGKALVKNSMIVNLYGSSGRFSVGNGDSPNSTIP